MYNEQELRLQSILLPTAEVCDVEELYFHRNGNEVDFDGYFNFFSLDKWRKYTLIEDLWLHIELSGFYELRIMNDRRETATIPLDPEEKKSYDIEFPYGDHELKRVLWFRLIAPEGSEPDTAGITGYFYTRTDRRHLRAVNIVADICTFKREAYVLRNLRQLKQRILDREELEVSRHFQIYIVDNGRTLDKHEEISKLIGSLTGRARVFPNKNAGGAGGFTRGMIEAIRAREKEGLTHVLLMDDDAVNEPDAIVRTYALLCTLRDEWKDTAIGGAMMEMEFPYILHQNGGELKDCREIPLKIDQDMRIYENAACDYLAAAGGEFSRFTGWWYYCVPLTTVREDNLPLPVFVHYDDIEFGIRNKDKGLICLNGICVWHHAFATFPSSLNAYMDMRNKLIMYAIHNEGQIKGFKNFIRNIVFPVFSYVARYRYTDIKIINKAIEDFLKGPQYLMSQEPGRIVSDISDSAVRTCKLSECDQLNYREKAEVELYISDFTNDKILDTVHRDRNHRLYLKNFLPFKKYRFLILSVAEAPYNYFGYKKVAYVDPYSQKVYVGKRNIFLIIKIMVGCIGIQRKLNRGMQVIEEYKKAFHEMTSIEFWDGYLEIER